ncbi:hypothetical protein LRS05_13445 [Flavobacterium sp. J372]|uniref:hypothetical protein n=1 Tax=Flavobacterium sp. J372 TaxID=2898436 RepID=UPI00215117A2|nr:hypothetical protein [Flavobacterium sp. J372]MCR5863069.1 hypothetical protein [Flavobacterium sp. J372]
MSLKTTLLFAFLLMISGVSAQDSPGLRPELLIAKNVKIKPLPDAAIITKKAIMTFILMPPCTSAMHRTKTRAQKPMRSKTVC